MKLETYLKCLGSNIKNARIRAGLRQVDVNSKADVTYRHYQNIEAGKINVTIATLRRLAGVLNVSICDLVKNC